MNKEATLALQRLLLLESPGTDCNVQNHDGHDGPSFHFHEIIDDWDYYAESIGRNCQASIERRSQCVTSKDKNGWTALHELAKRFDSSQTNQRMILSFIQLLLKSSPPPRSGMTMSYDARKII